MSTPLLALEALYESPQDVFKSMKPSIMRRRILPAFATLLATLAMVAMCYGAYDYHLDRISLADIRSLDIQGDIPKEYFGRKTVDKWERLQRRSTTMKCDEKWSNYQICSSNAILHSNCIEVCDTSYNTCSGCSELQTNHDFQLGLAQSHCETKKNAQCALNTVNGKLDYVSFSQCCLSAAGPVGADACFCEVQQFSAGSCFAYGNCQPATCNVESHTCPGTYTLGPAQPPSCEDTGAIKCYGPGTEQAIQCGMVDGVQWLLQVDSLTCAATCDKGVPVQGASGVIDTCSDAMFYQAPFYPTEVGCYIPSAQFLQGYLHFYPPGTLVSPESCAVQCTDFGALYCGITAGGSCYGGFSLDFGVKTTLDQCEESCAQDSAHFCGGPSTLYITGAF